MREPRDWRGWIAYTMSLGVSVGFATALIMSASSRTPPIGENTAQLLATLGGAMIGAIAAYLGMGRRDPPDDDKRDEL
jgi:purine-cytosine permease-like protein